MTNNLDLLIQPPYVPADTYRMGTVTSSNPWRVQLDGDATPTLVTPIIASQVGELDRVLVQNHNRQMIIVGRISKFSPVIELGGGVDLNDLTDARLYHQAQNVEAGSGSNYPSSHAGLLEVFNTTHVTGGYTYIYQRYSLYSNAEVWQRSKYGGTWYPWRRLLGSSRDHDWSTITGWDSTVELYSSGTPIQVCTVGGAVYLNGGMKLKGTSTSGKIGNLPSWAYPDSLMWKEWICQGSGKDHWGLRVDNDGSINWERYGPTTPVSGKWLPFNVSWPQVQ